MNKQKIYCFSNVRGGGDGIAYAMAEDGTVLGSHWCSHECYVPGDLGVTEGSRLDRHEGYAKHYPAGYEMEFVPAREVKRHEGLARAFALNKQQKEEAKAQESSNERAKAAPATTGLSPTSDASWPGSLLSRVLGSGASNENAETWRFGDLG